MIASKIWTREKRTRIQQNSDRRFDELTSYVEKMAIAQMAAEEHGDALQRQWPGLMMVSTGFRQRRNPSGTYALHPEPSVLLTVSEKWSSDAQDSAPHALPLPRRLYVTVDTGQNQACFGVPTDVQDMKWLTGVVPQGASQIQMSSPGNPIGALTCALDVKTAYGSQRFALSALHVLSPMPDVDRAPRPGTQFAPVGGPGIIGVSAPFGGALRSNAPSLDAQLASINLAALQAAFGNLPRGSIAYARSSQDINLVASTSTFVVAVPTNAAWGGAGPRPPVYSQFAGYVNASYPLTYNVTNNGVTFPKSFGFSELIVISAGIGNPVTLPGDSGSPVIAVSGKTPLLVGMLIAGPAIGSGTDKMFVLPAWSIFNPANWANAPLGTTQLDPAF